MANFVIEEEVLELDLDSFDEIDEVDCVLTLFVEENGNIEFIINCVDVVCNRGAVFGD